MSGDLLGNWKFVELLCVQWNPDMAARFPNADHATCRQEFQRTDDGIRPYDPVRCIGWHCNRCGQPTSCQGHHDCPDRPQPELDLSPIIDVPF